MFGFNPITYAIGGVVLLLLVLLGVQTVRLTIAHRDLAIARQHQAEAEGTAAKVNEIFAREEAKRERDRAAALASWYAETTALRNERDAIETRFKNVSADRRKLSEENRRLIRDAPKSDSVVLGRTMATFFNRLRQQQAARTNGTPPAP